MRPHRVLTMAVAGALTAGLIAACGGSPRPATDAGADGGDAARLSAADAAASGAHTSRSGPIVPTATVTIRVAGLLPTADEAAKKQLAERVASFEAKYPTITVTPVDYNWTNATFTSQLAGGTLPNVFEIPLSDGETLIEQHQLADIDRYVRALPYGNDFNPALIAGGTGEDGKIYAVPAKSIYAVALHYNRDLFREAGLDPDDPPTTWARVRADAKAIHDATGVAGYAAMALDASGGWQLAAAANSRGGVIEKVGGDGKYVATLDDPAVERSLRFLKNLRWTDDSLWPRADLGWGEINAAFGRAELAMYTSGSDVYNALVQADGVDKNWGYGLTAIPTENGGGALTGGTMAAMTTTSTDDQEAAGVLWMDWWYLAKLQDKDQAIADAKTLADANPPQAVGTPVLPIFSQNLYEQNQEWIARYINVPLADMKGYTNVMFTQPLVPEAAVATQDLYNALVPVVRAVITDKDADIHALLEAANKTGQAAIDADK